MFEKRITPHQKR